MPLLAVLLPFLSNVLPDVLKRVLPAEKMSEAESAKVQADITLELMKQDWAQVEAAYADRKDARALAAQDIANGNALTTFLAATVRPLWGLGAFVLVGWCTWKQLPIPGALENIIEMVLGFYFGGRVVEKIMPTVAGMIGGLKK